MTQSDDSCGEVWKYTLLCESQVQRIIDFETLLRLTPEQWATNLTSDHDLGATEYNQSWAMVYFLVHAKDKYGKDKYRSRLIDMLRLLRDRKDADTAFQEAFSSNIAGFQARFTEYVEDRRRTPTDDVMTGLATAASRY